MSKKTRLRKSLADLEFGDGDIEVHTTRSSSNLGIRNKYQLNDVHKSFLDTCLYEKTKMVLVDGPAGTAKAQPLDADILTPAGWKRMGDIQVGDDVITADGTATRVMGVFPQGEKDIYAVHFSDGTSTECCDDHLWFTQTYNDRVYRKKINGEHVLQPREGSVKTLADIRKTLYVGKSTNANHKIPICSPVKFNSKDHIIHPYILGVLLGDGGITHRVSFTTTDREIQQKVLDLLPDNLKMTNVANISYNISPLVKGSSNIFYEELCRLNLFGKKSADKFIPEEYLFDSIENRTALLQGLMDTDGWADMIGGTGFNSVSHQLVNNVRFLVESLGGVCGKLRSSVPSFTYLGKRKQGQMCYSLIINLDNTFSLPRKAEKAKKRTKYFPARYIKKVEYVGKKEAQCIMVADKSHLYLTNNCIVTHNTFLAVYAGLLLLQEKKIKNIVYIRSIVESATKSIGALPGELDEKFKPWSLPLLDKLNELIAPTTIDGLMESNTIKCIPVNFVRGLTFHDSMVIIDEFQNLTHEEGVTILTRFGHNSKYIAIGDARQADIGSKSGFKDLFNAFDDEESAEHGIHTFKFGENEIVRSKILRFIVSKIAKVKKSG